MRTRIKQLYGRVAFIAAWGVFLILCYYSFQKGNENLSAKMENSLHEAVNIDYRERLNKLTAYQHGTALGRKTKEIQIEGEEGIETICLEDSLRETSAMQLASQYVMAQISPIDPDKLNELFEEEWEKNGITATKTGIIYRNNEERAFSYDDSVSVQSALVTPALPIDIRKTIDVQAWAIIPWTETVRQTAPHVLWSLIAYFMVLLWASPSFLRKPQEKKVLPNRQDAIIQVGKMTLKPESKKVYIDNRPCILAPMDFQLLMLFANAPGQSLSKEDIRKMLWPKDDNADNKIYNHIFTLKAALKEFPGYQIITEPQGYRLVISSAEENIPL